MTMQMPNNMSNLSNKVIAMLVVAALMISLIIIFAMIGFDLTPVEDVHLEKVVVVEGYENAFCESYNGKSGELNEQCGDLTRDNCLSTSCCVYAKMDGAEKCFAGNEHGPTFRFDKSGKTNEIDYYYYQNKCYGKDCN